MVLLIEKKKRHLRRVLRVKRKIVRSFSGYVSYSQRHGRTFQRRPVNYFWFPLTLVHSYLCEQMTFNSGWAQGQLRNDCTFAQKKLFPDDQIQNDHSMIPTRKEAW